MRIEPIHSETRRVQPVDRQDRREQRRKDEDRPERENLEEAYKLSLRQGTSGASSPFVPGAYKPMPAKAVPESEATEPHQPAPDKPAHKLSQTPSAKPYSPSPGRSAGGKLDTYS